MHDLSNLGKSKAALVEVSSIHFYLHSTLEIFLFVLNF